MRKFLLFLVLSIALISCKTHRVLTDKYTEVGVPIVNTRIEYRDRLVYDSIYCRDSIYTYIKGDTIIKYKDRIDTRFINKTDTVVKRDTVKVPVKVTSTEIKTVEVNKLNWFQKVMMVLGFIPILAILLFITVQIKKRTV